ncbi:hypothetical protein HNR12_001059 [Streptomonospora nanhaiensis]|uniref:Uncharacterized protein n=1 Tax=Streptomonospora nanhaiensis TaxID=1323731 RepID=A0A853BJN9_9ACTN|nr:hypothetical protein [Streptomonospora nanhaiensis]NYI94782.1 hypothetical protein [Streptomonospora nanhaiensis]
MLPLLMGALGVAVVALAVVLVLQFVSGGSAPENPVPTAYETHDTGDEILATREVDSRPLSEGEIFGDAEEIDSSSQNVTFTLAESGLTEDCASAVWGEEVAAALADADCTQAARAGYTSGDYLGAAVMFNLRDQEAAQAVATALKPPKDPEAEPAGFITVPGADGELADLGAGYSAAEATVSGHYLTVTWVQATDSTDTAERESLVSPLIALSAFRDPLYNRVVQLETLQESQTTTTPVA